MASKNTVEIGFGSDWSIIAGSKSQRQQGSVAFVRSAALTVNGKPAEGTAVRQGFRLNATTAAAFLAARPVEGKAGRVTLPLVKRGRPVGQSVGLAGLAALVGPAKSAPRKARKAPAQPEQAPASAE